MIHQETVESAKEILADAGSVVSFSGAGLSAESGIPTFRDAATQGFWTKYDPTKMASPAGFSEDREVVHQWYAERRRGIAAAKPNDAHLTLGAREDIIHVTQNIDDLLHRAGAMQETIFQLHGSIARDRCLNDACDFCETIDLNDPPALRKCPKCDDWLRPDVVWFGELLPGDIWEQAEQACLHADVLLVIGTSAEVQPAAGLIGLAKASGSKIIVVNTNQSGASNLADAELIGKAGDIVPQLL